MGSAVTRHRRSSTAVGLFGWLFGGIPVLVCAAAIAGALGCALGSYLHFSADLPGIPDLRAYRPKTVSTFYADDDSVIGLFFHEKRFPTSPDALPPHVVNAFLAAEDARFFSHSGVDILGVARALWRNVQAGGMAQGGSTITQQVTRAFILSKEKKLSRKVKEAILSVRLEKTLTKKEILGLYLNEIYLGKGSYGVEAAARTYFGVSARELALPQAALIAGMVANPSRYTPARNLQACMKRRAFVLDNMLRYGFITEEEHGFATADTPTFREHLPNPYERVPYFTEAVRQYVVAKYGEHRLYSEGLQVWTTCDPNLQDKAADSLLRGAKAWERRQNRASGTVRRLSAKEATEFAESSAKDRLSVGQLCRALVVENHTPKKRKGQVPSSKTQELTVSLAGNTGVKVSLESDVMYRPNDLLEFRVVELGQHGPVLEHRPLPHVEGAVVCIENSSGYVRALVGGLDFDRSRFNRAIQAYRQPGSAFKPFVFAAGLEYAGYTPQTLVLDEPVAVLVRQREPEWIPSNSDGQYLGLMNLRDSLAMSRNIVAVKLLMDVGTAPTVRLAQSMGISSKLSDHLSLSLGTSEVTPLELTAAYTVFPNMGFRVKPVMVKKIVDRFGKVLEDNTLLPTPLPEQIDIPVPYERSVQDQRLEDGPDQPDDDPDDDEATVAATTEQPSDAGVGREPSGQSGSNESAVSQSSGIPCVLSPQSSYLMVSMLRKVCVSGTAAAAAKLNRRDIAGKTGTTDNCTDAWFVGFSPRYTTGVWMGHDAKLPLGRDETGAKAALPVWMSFMGQILKNEPSRGYHPPPGILFSVDDRQAGSIGLEDLLEADPAPWPTQQRLAVSPVDINYVLASGPVNPFTGVPVPMSYTNRARPGAVRVLMPTGEEMGMAYFVPDKKGRPVLYRDYLTQNRQASASPFQDQQATDVSAQGHPDAVDPSRWFTQFLRQNGWIR